jgi:hypothetical protein
VTELAVESGASAIEASNITPLCEIAYSAVVSGLKLIEAAYGDEVSIASTRAD